MPYIGDVDPMGRQLMYFENPRVPWVQEIVSIIVYYVQTFLLTTGRRTQPQSNSGDTNGLSMGSS